jgi:pyrimidine-nucleoside phosphorylase
LKCSYQNVNFLSLIEAKRDGHPLTSAQLGEIVRASTNGAVPDYQIAAFLMAVYFRGLPPEETRALTLAMRDSGEVLHWPADSRPVVDKHSTGGIGDKVSLPLAPLLACLGFRVPMISGRGLGITGGTLDKLDSIPGFRTLLPPDQLIETVQRVGCVICGQTESMVPADKALYALRDVTGTVPSIPLIVSSILSKKLAEGLDALLLDVKFGRGAFMHGLEQARELAQNMAALGTACGVKTRALLTRMDAPLGRAAGNWLEVKESAALLAGTGIGLEDLRELVLISAANLLVQTERAASLADARGLAEKCLASGAARKKWEEMLEAQGADLKALERKLALDHTAPAVVELPASTSGFVSHCDARLVGEVVRDLGGGRRTRDSILNYDVGVDRLAKPGDPVKAGSLLLRVHAPDRARAEDACARLAHAFQVTDELLPQPPLVAECVGEL